MALLFSRFRESVAPEDALPPMVHAGSILIQLAAECRQKRSSCALRPQGFRKNRCSHLLEQLLVFTSTIHQASPICTGPTAVLMILLLHAIYC